MPALRSAVAAVAATAAGALVLTAAAPVAASGLHEPPPWTVVTGLNNPRGITFGPDGALFVAESGRGGAGPCQAGPEGGEVCFGRSGSITRIKNGRSYRIVTQLPSLASRAGTEAAGPSDVGVDRHGKLYFTVGLGGPPSLRKEVPALRGMAKLYKNTRYGPSAVADIGAYEQRVNPDGISPPDTNPQGLAVVGSSQFVVDAGGNSLVKVNDRGRISTVATFRVRSVLMPAVPGNPPGVPPPGKPIDMQAVPTAAVIGPDGAWYVSQLTGFPFPVGGARIFRVVPGHRPTVYATGLTNVIDLAWGPDRKLYALEITKNGLLSGDETGALLRVNRRGPHKVVASQGLRAPGGVAIRGKYAYVTNCGICAGTGSVVRVPLH
jgi:hypothetical protein